MMIQGMPPNYKPATLSIMGSPNYRPSDQPPKEPLSCQDSASISLNSIQVVDHLQLLFPFPFMGMAMSSTDVAGLLYLQQPHNSWQLRRQRFSHHWHLFAARSLPCCRSVSLLLKVQEGPWLNFTPTHLLLDTCQRELGKGLTSFSYLSLFNWQAAA